MSSRLAGRAIVQPSQEKQSPVLCAIDHGSPAILHHGNHLSLGTEVRGDDARIMVVAASAPCTCGCGQPRQGIVVYVEPDSARAVAAELLAMAEEAEAKASADAAAALRRAGGK